MLGDLFRSYDKDNSGFLEESELLKAIQNIMGDLCTPRLVKLAMGKLDTDGDNKLNLDEFYEFFEIIDQLLS